MDSAAASNTRRVSQIDTALLITREQCESS